jgi:anti-sigma factor RsiW
VLSADQHTVKPWFEGHVDFAPPVPDLVAQGFPLVGGRLDYLDNRPVAALVYKRQQHVINLFVWPAPSDALRPASTVTRHGYNLVQWTTAGMTYWAISTLNAQETEAFAHEVQQHTTPPPKVVSGCWLQIPGWLQAWGCLRHLYHRKVLVALPVGPFTLPS